MRSSFYTQNIELKIEYSNESGSGEESAIFENFAGPFLSEFEKALERITKFEKYLRLIRKLATFLNAKYLN
jgi:hypothetical protein